MNWLQKTLELFATQSSFFIKIIFLILFTRLIFLENNQLFLFFEMLFTIVVLIIKDPQK
jgi:hypothetical protein